MRFLLPLLVTAGAVTAQSPLTTTFANNNGGAAGGAVYFELEALDPAGVTITDIDLNMGGAGGVAGTIDVYIAASGTGPLDPGWSLYDTGTFTSAPVGTATNCVLNTGVGIGGGDKFAFAIVNNGAAHAYTTGTAPFQLVYTTTELELTAGQASNAPFTGTIFTPRVVNTNINYVSGGTSPAIASATSEGNGCAAGFASFYEEQDPVSMDLAGTELMAINTGAGYVVTAQASTINAVGSLDPLAVPLVLGDDVSVAAGTNGIEVFSNCQVAFGPGNDTNWTPDVATLLSNPSTAAYAWTDLSPNLTGSGQVTYEEAGTVWQVTYDGVYAFGTTDPSTVQFRGDVSTGDFTIAFGAVLHTTGPENWLVGYSVGGPSPDPGASDLSAAATIPVITGVDQFPLELTADNRPVIDPAAPATVTMTTSNIEPTAIFHLTALGLSNPNLPINALLPAVDPGCTLNAALDGILGPDVIAGLTTHTHTPVTIPANVTLAGFEMWVQAFTLDLTLVSGTTRASNGIKLKLGTL